MDKMKQLVRDVKQLEAKLLVCTRCGVCQASCPLFAQTRKEADVSRGKLALINGLIDGMFDDAKGVNKRLQRCLLCGSCTHGCPSSVNVLEIFLFARTIISKYLGLPFGQKLLLKKLLANPGAFNTVMGMAASFQSLFFKTQDNVQGTSCARIASPLLRHRNIVPLEEKAFHMQLEKLDFRKSGKGVKVAFFVGCLIDKALPNIAFSVVDCLQHFNARIFIPSDQGCCGIPALASGDMATFEILVKKHVDLFSSDKFDYLVTACATCSSTIIKLWPALLKDKYADTNKDLLKKIEALSEKTVDISWLLAKRFDLTSAISDNDEKKPVVTVHDPCHLKKSLDVFQEPRNVVQAAGHEIVEMKDSDVCCGMGGSFNLKHYELSSKIGLKKAKNIVDTKASIVATSCPACMMQLSDMLAKLDADVAVVHPVELYAKALK
ncbi:MAG: (Fe-S)-binding protein [Desulfobacula sp.]|nr:(Fe-S)-binding protein [Desulfobacula sp.]